MSNALSTCTVKNFLDFSPKDCEVHQNEDSILSEVSPALTGANTDRQC